MEKKSRAITSHPAILIKQEEGFLAGYWFEKPCLHIEAWLILLHDQSQFY